MQKESGRSIFNKNRYKKRYILTFISLCALSWYLFDFFYRPTYTHSFPFAQGEHVWDVKINKHCAYTFGFVFKIPDDYPGDLNQVFGNFDNDIIGVKRSIFASFNLDVFNQQGDKVRMLVPPGKRVFSFAYQSNDKAINLTYSGGGYNKEKNRLTYRFADLSMPPGKYKVIIDITQANSELKKFRTSAFLTSSIKFTCS